MRKISMDAKALICDEKQSFSIEAVRLPECAPDQVAIRTYYSGVSIGTEFAYIRNKLSPGPYPLSTGYMGTGIVETVGSAIDNFAVGDEVYFRGNDSMALADGTSVTSVTGAHCSRIVTRPNTTHGVAHLPPRRGTGRGVYVRYARRRTERGGHGQSQNGPDCSRLWMWSHRVGGHRRLRAAWLQGYRCRHQRKTARYCQDDGCRSNHGRVSG